MATGPYACPRVDSEPRAEHARVTEELARCPAERTDHDLADLTELRDHPPALLRRVRRRRRQDRAGVAAGGGVARVGAAAGRPRGRRSSRRQPAGPAAAALRRRRRSASSTCSWPAAPSQLDLFDYKPALAKFDGQPMPPEVVEGPAVRVHPAATPTLLGPRFKFAQARPERRGAVGDAAAPRRRSPTTSAIVKSMHTDQFNHAPGADLPQHRLAAARPAEHGVVGDVRPRQRGRPTCPASSSCPAARGTSGGPAQLGQRVPADASTRACRSAARATRSSTSPTRRASTPQLQRDSLDLRRAT